MIILICVGIFFKGIFICFFFLNINIMFFNLVIVFFISFFKRVGNILYYNILLYFNLFLSIKMLFVIVN